MRAARMVLPCMSSAAATESGAARAGIALVAGGESRVVKVIAARALEQVAADRCHVPELRRRPGEQRERNERIALPHERVVRGIAVGGHGADPQAAAGQLF